MRIQFLGRSFDKGCVAGIEFKLGIDVFPLHVTGVVAGSQRKSTDARAGGVVKIHRHRLHPSVVRVTRIVDITWSSRNMANIFEPNCIVAREAQKQGQV